MEIEKRSMKYHTTTTASLKKSNIMRVINKGNRQAYTRNCHRTSSLGKVMLSRALVSKLKESTQDMLISYSMGKFTSRLPMRPRTAKASRHSEKMQALGESD